MKRCLVTCLFSLCTGWLLGCSGGHSPDSAAIEASARVVGQEAGTALRQALQQELMAAMKVGGPAAGIKVCASKAEQITQAGQLDHPAVLEVKRVTDRPRNPDNRATPADLTALQALAALPASTPGAPPADFVAAGERGDTVMFYQALHIQPVCLTCHGPAEQLPPVIQQALTQQYPTDQATGYALGDLRGAIRVTLDPTQLPIGPSSP